MKPLDIVLYDIQRTKYSVFVASTCKKDTAKNEAEFLVILSGSTQNAAVSHKTRHCILFSRLHYVGKAGILGKVLGYAPSPYTRYGDAPQEKCHELRHHQIL